MSAALIPVLACAVGDDSKTKQLETEIQTLRDENARLEAQLAARDRERTAIEVPIPAAKDVIPSTASLVVSIATSGQVAVNDEAVTAADLDRAFRRAFEEDPNAQVIINADASAAHAVVVGVIERAKRVGLSRISIAVQGAE